MRTGENEHSPLPAGGVTNGVSIVAIAVLFGTHQQTPAILLLCTKQ